MNMGRVEFKADFVKIALAKKNQITLELPEDVKIEKIVEIAKLRGQRVNVLFGDPQASMEDYGVDIEQRQIGAKVTIVDGNVEKVEPAAGEQDELTWEVESQEPEEEGADDASEGGGSDPEGEDEQTDGEGSEEPQEEPQNGTDELSGAKNERDELDAFILERKPHFEDMPYDFPSILQRKRNGEEWLQISTSLGMTKGQLETKFRAYKKRVKDLLA